MKRMAKLLLVFLLSIIMVSCQSPAGQNSSAESDAAYTAESEAVSTTEEAEVVSRSNILFEKNPDSIVVSTKGKWLSLFTKEEAYEKYLSRIIEQLPSSLYMVSKAYDGSDDMVIKLVYDEEQHVSIIYDGETHEISYSFIEIMNDGIIFFIPKDITDGIKPLGIMENPTAIIA